MAEKMGKRGEKSQFSVTCSLLSQYLKEKGGFGNIGLGMAPRPLHHQPEENLRAPTTLSLLPGADVSTDNNPDQNAPKSMELFPQHAGFKSPVLPAKEESVKPPSNVKESEKAQLTIFYGGKVMVFDDFPADKAKDLLQMAGKESVSAQKLGFAAPSSSAGVECPAAPPQNGLPKPAQANASDMPIARRNSLHRFLEKRKDRISTKAPYQVAGGLAAAPDAAKSEDSQPWLGLGRKSVKQEV